MASVNVPNLVYTSVQLMHYAVHVRHVFGARLINFPRTSGEQRRPVAWKGHLAHPVLFVFTQKTDKVQFVVNGMQTVRVRRSTG